MLAKNAVAGTLFVRALLAEMEFVSILINLMARLVVPMMISAQAINVSKENAQRRDLMTTRCVQRTAIVHQAPVDMTRTSAGMHCRYVVRRERLLEHMSIRMMDGLSILRMSIVTFVPTNQLEQLVSETICA